MLHMDTAPENLPAIPYMLSWPEADAALSPLAPALVSICFMAIPPVLQTVHYIITSLAILLICTLWAMGTWKLSFWEIFPPICMAAILQVAMTALSQILFRLFLVNSPLQYTLTLGIHFSAVLASALLLKKIHFGAYFQLLMENQGSLHHTALLIFALEITMEAFLILQRGIHPAYLAMYYLLVIVLTALMTGLLVYLARQFDARRRLQTQQDVIAQQQLYEQDLEDIRREVRSFRHDYKNLLTSLSEQADAGEWEELRLSLAKLDIGFEHRLGEKIQFSTHIGNLQIPPGKKPLSQQTHCHAEK